MRELIKQEIESTYEKLKNKLREMKKSLEENKHISIEDEKEIRKYLYNFDVNDLFENKKIKIDITDMYLDEAIEALKEFRKKVDEIAKQYNINDDTKNENCYFNIEDLDCEYYKGNIVCRFDYYVLGDTKKLEERLYEEIKIKIVKKYLELPLNIMINKKIIDLYLDGEINENVLKKLII